MVIILFTVACAKGIDIDPDPIEWDELREVDTDGRLHISGLNTYNGQFIAAHVTLTNIYLVAYEQLSNAYLNGEFVKGGTESTNAIVIDDQARLKIFKEIDGSGYYENYNGNDQNITFHVGIWNKDDIWSNYGIVTVNFTNGAGSGVFVLEIPN